MKVSNTSTVLYFGISGSGMSTTTHQIFIDTDNNSSTGFQDTRFTSSGANYMIENSNLYQSTGTGWAWTGVTATIVSSKNATATELSINRSALGTLASTIRVAFLDLNASYVLQSQLPATGNAYASYTLGSGRFATEEMSSDMELVAYPNPVSSRYLNVESSEEIGELTMFNLNGVIVHRDDKSSNKKVVDTEGMVKGMYFLKARMVRGVRIVKVIVE